MRDVYANTVRGALARPEFGDPATSVAASRSCYPAPVRDGGDETIATEFPGQMHTGISLSQGIVFANRYRILELLGRGGMGSVFLVHDEQVDERVALKVLTLDGESSALDRFRREVRLARRVTHPNAARTYDLGEFEGMHFLTMEYIHGEDLRTRLERGVVDPADAATIARQIAAGLAAAHAADIVHRDLKPANVLIETTGRVVITDFGVARASSGIDATMQTGGTIGTPAYMAPEQIIGKPVDARADVYALGLILYQMLAGALPFAEKESMMAVAFAWVHGEPDDLRARTELPPALTELVMRCLAREPEQRLASAAALTDALAQICVELGARELKIEVTPPRHTAASGLYTRPSDLDTGGSHTTAPRQAGTGSLRSGGTNRKSLAVLPLRFRGPAAEEHLAEALTDELVDVLSLVKRLDVTNSGTSTQFSETKTRDPRKVGQALRVDAIVDGSMQLAGRRARINVHLVDVASGFQVWRQRFEAEVDDPFEFQDKVGARIGEALRANLEAIVHRQQASDEAFDVYTKARRLVAKWDWREPSPAVPLFAQAIELAPAFKPAYSGYALWAMRTWFMTPGSGEAEAAAEAEARDAVSQALDVAPELAETQLAAAMLAVQEGDFREAALRLAKALELAPTYAEALEYLGDLKLEAGRAEEGKAHLELAVDLRPTLVGCYSNLARYFALNGDYAKADDALARMRTTLGRSDTPVVLTMMRIGAWARDRERVVGALSTLDTISQGTHVAAIRSVGELLLATPESSDWLREVLGRFVQHGTNPRMRSFLCQIAAEVCGFHGEIEVGLGFIEQAVETVLVDLYWLERCPLFEGLRGREEFQACRVTTRARAELIWEV